MSDEREAGQGGAGRRERLKAALRENLKRRKAQARARADEGGERGPPADAPGTAPRDPDPDTI